MKNKLSSATQHQSVSSATSGWKAIAERIVRLQQEKNISIFDDSTGNFSFRALVNETEEQKQREKIIASLRKKIHNQSG